MLPLKGRENGVHALIIEDESFIALEIEDVLRGLGFRSFDFAISPEDALDAASRRCPDLITSDVDLKPGCGISTVIRICNDAMIPVIFITGTGDEVRRRLPQRCILEKPFSDSQLTAAVQDVLSKPAAFRLPS